MGLALALIVMGLLIFLDRLGTGYGLREGWPWLVVALGIGGILRNRTSVAAWITTILGILILGAKYYSIQFSIPSIIKTYFLPVLLIVIGLLWLLRHKKDWFQIRLRLPAPPSVGTGAGRQGMRKGVCYLIMYFAIYSRSEIFDWNSEFRNPQSEILRLE